MPCRSEILKILPASQVCTGTDRQMAKRINAAMELTLKNTLPKKAGSAWPGEFSGLTRNTTIRREVVERSAERMMPKRREFMTFQKSALPWAR